MKNHFWDMGKIFKTLFYITFFVLIYLLLSYKLTSVPPGINIDESSVGYNASLIEKSLRDENNRFMPVFILTLDGKDWKNPVNIYSTVAVFKILGRSYFNLRLVSVIYALVSAFLFWRLLRLFFSERLSFAGLLLFLLSPSILLQSHLASDNISGLPFFLLWLYFLFSYLRKKQSWQILASGIFLGVAFYSYKGMRAMVPVYLVLSLIYLFYWEVFKKKDFKSVILFLMGAVPFFLPLKWLQIHYAGALYDPNLVSRPSFFDAAYTYLSSFDFSFLFVKGDLMLIHSTGHHGMFLIPTLVLFFLGLFQAVEEKNKYYYFLLAVLLLTPLLFILVGSVYRASRLMTYIPIFTFFFTLGVKRILEVKPIFYRNFILVFLSVAIFLNYADFVRYYWNEYPRKVLREFYPNANIAMNSLQKLSKENQMTPYIERNLFAPHKFDWQFFWEMYFPDKNLNIWTREIEPLPARGLVLTFIGGSGEMVNYKEIPSPGLGQQSFYIVGKR